MWYDYIIKRLYVDNVYDGVVLLFTWSNKTLFSDKILCSWGFKGFKGKTFDSRSILQIAASKNT